MNFKHLFLVAAALALASFQAFAQHTVQGKVTDSQGGPIPGASVFELGTSNGVITDLDGLYSIRVSESATLEVSFLGMKTQKIPVNGRKTINVVLEDDATVLNEVVVVGYGTQQKASLTNAVSTVRGSELLKAPAVGVSAAVGTRVAGVVALQQSGQPGADAASLLVRGQSAVCIVDGVARGLNEIDPNEIESISVLKDATSAAMYGLNSSAVILVTTKKGDSQKTRISYNGEYGVSRNTNMLRLLNGPEYAYWYNKALELDSQAMGTEFHPVFLAEQVQWMKEGTNGWGNTDWYAKTFGTGITQHHNVSATGGNDKVRFFASLGYYDQDGNVTGFNYHRYNLRTNLEAKITNDLTFEINVAGRIESREQPGFSANPDDWSNIPQQAVRTLPYLPETYEINGTVYPVSGRTASSWVNPLAAASESGKRTTRDTYIQSNMSLRYDVPFIKGLSLKEMVSFDTTFDFVKQLSTPYYTAVVTLPVATFNASGDQIPVPLSYGLSTDARGTSTSLTESGAWSYNITTQTSLDFDRAFGDHKIHALALLETRENRSHALGATGWGLDFVRQDELSYITNQTGDGSEKIPNISGYSGHTRVAGYVGRLNYSYKDKYLLEASFRYDGSYVFEGKSGARWVSLPGVSAGWVISKEDWFNVPAIDMLKLRASVGKTANSNVAAYQYMDLVSLSKKQVIFGGASESMVYASTLGNPNLTWAKVDNYNVGLDFEAWKGLLGLEFDVFYKYEYDILSSVTGSYPPSRGGYYYSSGNDNKRDYKGFDFTIRHNNSIGEVNYGAKLVLTYAYRRWLYYAGDSDNTPDYLKVTGKEVGSQEGFISLGLFQTDEEAASSATIPGSRVAAGYIKYLDRNGDGKITYAQDRGYVAGSPYPRVQGSLNLFASWRGFDLDMLWQGATGRTVSLTGVYTATGSEYIMDNTFLTKPFYHGGNSPLFLLERSWLPGENPDGEFPRPTITALSSNNAYSSTFWYRDGTYLRLKTLQVGYSFPERWIKKVGVSALRLYLQGSNLLTFSGLTKYNIDPEQPGVNNGYYPQQKTYQLGVKITF